MHQNDIYDLKLYELKSCLKSSLYHEKEILKKVLNIEIWAKVNGLSIEKFNLEQILMIAKEIRRLYEVLWDWKSRLESKEKYEKLINDVENQFYLFHQQTFGGVGLNPNIK